MKESIRAYSTSTPLTQPTRPPPATVSDDHQRPGQSGVGQQPHRQDVHQPDIVGDREIVVAGGDHHHLGQGEQRDRGVVAEDGAERLRCR